VFLLPSILTVIPFELISLFSLLPGVYFTCRAAHFLGVAASWIVQVGVDIYKALSHLFNTKEELDEVDKRKEFELLGRKILSATIRCTASLVFAAIGAGLGALLIRPSLGQWLGTFNSKPPPPKKPRGESKEIPQKKGQVLNSEKF